MQLRIARLCLNCEEVHDDPQCPVCTSESFAYLTRWVPVGDRRQDHRPLPAPAAAPSATSTSATPGTSSSLRWARRGVAGVVVVAVSQWLWRHSRPVEWTESGSDTTGRAREDTVPDRPTRDMR
jgi:hypothetical protein